MGWSVLGRVLDTADLGSSGTVYQKVIFNKDLVLRSMQTWFIVYNNPTFTDLYFKVYSLDGTTPKKLIYTSTNVILKADMFTENYGIKGVRFDFGDVAFRATTSYAFVPRATGYTASGSSYLAWKLAWPDPAYRTNIPLSDKSNAGRSPYDITGFIGAKL